ncbi:MAG: dihydropteroate synthase [Verrucomicrobiae bacterium]|nr:dihydropteroate synthase [Verrucomicrobiae bacterium]
MTFHCCHHQIPLEKKALILGILNVTPDSCSDGGNFFDPQKAVARGLELIAEGADIIDVGGESTRPGAAPISPEEEIRRVLPVIQGLRTKTDAPISIDTSKAAVAEAAIEAGASIINDVTALSDPKMGEVAASTRAGLILMHLQGTPLAMQTAPSYPNDDVVTVVANFLTQARAKALRYGVQKNALVLDPGIGFGKTVAHNFSLLKAIPQLTQLGSPLLLGHSRKWFLNGVSGDYSPRALEERFIPSIAVTSIARYHGAMLFRVHDPRAHREAVRTTEQLLSYHDTASKYPNDSHCFFKR